MKPCLRCNRWFEETSSEQTICPQCCIIDRNTFGTGSIDLFPTFVNERRSLVINKLTWDVVFKKHKEMPCYEEGMYAFGHVNSMLLVIALNDEMAPPVMKQTIIHELTHAYIFSFGVDAPSFSQEAVCDFVAAHAGDIIRDADNLYEAWLQTRPLTVGGTENENQIDSV